MNNELYSPQVGIILAFGHIRDLTGHFHLLGLGLAQISTNRTSFFIVHL